MATTEIPIVKIGNSRGLRLAKSLLERYNIQDKVEIILEENQIILRPVKSVRVGWDKAFKELHQNGDDHLLMDDVFEDENFDEWS